MKKNVASQKVGAQLVSATDGSAFTGSVTVEVTGDAGTQATGSVGSGACTHEGNGYHTYAPAQAETNYDLVAFTFHGTGAVPVTVQIYTTFPQTGDTYALANGASGFVAIAGYIDTEIASIISTLATIAGYVDTEVAAIKTQTDKLVFTVAGYLDVNTLKVGGTTQTAGDIPARLPTALDTNGFIKAGLQAINGNTLAANNLKGGALGLVFDTCAAGSTTTSIVTNLTEATDDHYNGRVITFVTGALLGQTSSISDYTGATKTLTVVALTEAPADTDAFVIS